jgi:hypothetical protein
MLVLRMFHMRKLAFYTDLWAEIQSFSCVIYAVLGNSRKHPFAHSPHSHPWAGFCGRPQVPGCSAHPTLVRAAILHLWRLI